MNKILFFLLSIVSILGLVACTPNEKSDNLDEATWDEPIDNTTFEEYLENNLNNLTSSKIDEIFDFDIDIDNIIIPSLYLEVETDGVYDSEVDKAYIWKDENKIYAYYEENEEIILYNLDIVGFVNCLGLDIENKKISNLLEKVIVSFSNNPDNNLDYYLSKINLTLDDFIVRADGIYELKHSSIARIIEILSDGNISQNDAYNNINKTFEKLVINFKFANGKVRNIGVVLETRDTTRDLKISFSMKPIYAIDGVLGLEFGTNMYENYLSNEGQDYKISCSGKITSNELDISFALKNDKEYDLKLTYKAENINIKYSDIKEDTEHSILVDLVLVDNAVKSGTIDVIQNCEFWNEDGYMSVTITQQDFSLIELDLENSMDLLEIIFKEE